MSESPADTLFTRNICASEVYIAKGREIRKKSFYNILNKTSRCPQS